MSKAIAEIAIGAAIIALDIALPAAGIAVSATLLAALASTGAALVTGGIGTLLTKQQTGLGTTVRNPIAPWNVIYGRGRAGGITVFIESTGESDKYLHMVFVLACHPSKSVDALLMDNQRVILDPNGNSNSPTQWTANIAHIVRSGDVVTVTLATPFVGLEDGDTITIQNVTGDLTLNGIFAVSVINSFSFSYVCGGSPAIVDNEGQAVTNWPDYGDTIHMEVALGGQAPGSPPFPGLLATDDTGSNGLWTAQHLLQGRTAVYLRLKYGGNTYASGLPSIAFLVSGKNDVYDPRTDSRGYTTNAALCIADYLAHPVFGYKAVYGTEIPAGPLASAANICDESVGLANGIFEPRYSCNGGFQLTTKRGEILQNLLTCCAGRITYVSGQFYIWPAAWVGPSATFGSGIPTNAAGFPATSAIVTVWASWTNTSGAPATPVINAVFGAPRITQFDQSASSAILDTSTLSGTPSAITLRLDPFSQLSQLPVMNIVAFIEGTLSGTAELSTLNIYDCYVDVTYADASTARISPVNATYVNQDGGANITGFVANPGNAIDSDANPPTTFASITRTSYGGLELAGYLELSTFQFPGGSSITPSDVSLSDITGPFQWKSTPTIRDLYNGVKGVYVCPANHWQSSDIPPYAQDQDHGYTNGPAEFFHDANLAADGGDRRWFEIQLPFTISTAAAQRLAKIELLRRRQKGRGTFPFNLAAYRLTALDVVSFNLPIPGWFWSNKLLEVSEHRFTVNKREEKNGGGTVLGTELELRETDPSVYEWSSSEELSAQGYQQTPTNTVRSIAAPTGVTAVSDTTTAAVGSDGVATSTVQINWTAPTDGWITNGGYTVVQYQIAGATTWTGLGNFDPSTTFAYINGVTDGVQYNVRVAFVNLAGVQSAWTEIGPVTAGGSSLAAGLHFADDETPSGVMDGVNPTFTLAHVPNPAESLELYFNGDFAVPGVDFTLLGNTITCTSLIPTADDTLRAFYRY